MVKNSTKKYRCPYCSQTSSRKYNITIHIQRKHHYCEKDNSSQHPIFNEPYYMIDSKKPAFNWNRPMVEHPSPSAFFPSYNLPFYPYQFFYSDRDDDYDDERESRRLNKRLLTYMQKILMSFSSFQNTQFPCTNRIYNTRLSYPKRIYNAQFTYAGAIWNVGPQITPPKNMPIAHKIYKCDKCVSQILKPYFNFQEIQPANKFIHDCNCFFNQQQRNIPYNDSQISTLQLEERLLSIIDDRLRSENKLLKMIVLPTNFIENPLSLTLLMSLMDMMGNKEDYEFRWLFELLENERFIDLGKISSQHWANRAYYNDNEKYSADENVTKLEREELKQFISRTEGTFGLIKFRIDNNKIIYTFSYLLLNNEKTIGNSIIRFNK